MIVKRGLSLLEVIIALAILVGSAAVLAQLMDMGQRHALRTAEMTEAQTLCQNLLNELLAGELSWESTETQPVDPFSAWDYSVQIEPLEDGMLSWVSIIVRQRPAEELVDADADAPAALEFRLTRWAYHPEPDSASDAEPTSNESNIP